MIDVMAIKLKVIKEACGICSLSELELLHRLEKLYLEGIEEGVRIAKEHISRPVMNSPADEAEARDRANTAPRQVDSDTARRRVAGPLTESECRPVMPSGANSITAPSAER